MNFRSQKRHFNANFQSFQAQDLVQESRAVARKPRDAAAVLFGLKYVR